MLYVVDITCLCPGGIREHIRDVNEFEIARNRYVDELKNAAEQMIQEKWKEINQKGVKVSSIVKTGDPADQILDFARNEMVDAIIMGSSG